VSEIAGFIGKHKRVVAAAIIGILIFVYAPALIKSMSMVPGPEGVRCLTYGVAIGDYGTWSELYPVSDYTSLEGEQWYYWVSNDPSNMIVGHQKMPGEPLGGYLMNGPGWWYDFGQGQLRSEVQRPLLDVTNPPGFTSELLGKVLSYYKYVSKSETEVEITKVVTYIMPADFVIQISVVPGQGVYSFENVRLWYVLDTVTWMNAYASEPPPDPNPLTNNTVKFLSSQYRGAFPIYAWVDEYADPTYRDQYDSDKEYPPSEIATFVQLNPSLEGRNIDLYTVPGASYDMMLSSQIASNPDLVAEALKEDLGGLPDPRFSETVFFDITAIRFGAHVQPTGLAGTFVSYTEWYPCVYYRMRAVYAIYGEYVYLWTKQAAQEVGYTEDEWEVRETETVEVKDVTVGLIEFLGREYDEFVSGPGLWQLGIFGILALAAVSCVVLYWLFGFPKRRGRED